jgi:hypothetical protein
MDFILLVDIWTTFTFWFVYLFFLHLILSNWFLWNIFAFLSVRSQESNLSCGCYEAPLLFRSAGRDKPGSGSAPPRSHLEFYVFEISCAQRSILIRISSWQRQERNTVLTICSKVSVSPSRVLACALCQRALPVSQLMQSLLVAFMFAPILGFVPNPKMSSDQKEPGGSSAHPGPGDRGQVC